MCCRMRFVLSAASMPTPSRPTPMLSQTVFQGKSANCWNPTARSGPGRVTTSLSTITQPPVGCSRPAAMRMQVVLPQPNGPTKATNSRATTPPPPPRGVRKPAADGQAGFFPPPRRPDDGDELARADLQVDPPPRNHIPVALAKCPLHIIELDSGHGAPG